MCGAKSEVCQQYVGGLNLPVFVVYSQKDWKRKCKMDRAERPE